MNITSISFEGLRSSQNNIFEYSKKISNPNIDNIDPLIKLKQEELNFKANAKAISVSNEMIGTIIDIKV